MGELSLIVTFLVDVWPEALAHKCLYVFTSPPMVRVGPSSHANGQIMLWDIYFSLFEKLGPFDLKKKLMKMTKYLINGPTNFIYNFS